MFKRKRKMKNDENSGQLVEARIDDLESHIVELEIHIRALTRRLRALEKEVGVNYEDEAESALLRMARVDVHQEVVKRLFSDQHMSDIDQKKLML